MVEGPHYQGNNVQNKSCYFERPWSFQPSPDFASEPPPLGGFKVTHGDLLGYTANTMSAAVVHNQVERTAVLPSYS